MTTTKLTDGGVVSARDSTVKEKTARLCVVCNKTNVEVRSEIREGRIASQILECPRCQAIAYRDIDKVSGTVLRDSDYPNRRHSR